MHEKQYIYILVNPAHKNLLKIGKTNRNAEERAKELSAGTGIAHSFMVAYECEVSDASTAEKRIHNELTLNGFRTNASREFFEMALKDAVNVVNRICLELLPNLNRNGSDKIQNDNDQGEAFYIHGHAALYGTDLVFRDFDDAKLSFERSIAFGCIDAYKNLANMHLWGLGTRKNVAEAITLLKKGGAMGDPQCYLDLWSIYSGTERNHHADIDENTTELLDIYNADVAFELYMNLVDKNCTPIEYHISEWYLRWSFNLSTITKTKSEGRHTKILISKIVDEMRNQMIQIKDARAKGIALSDTADSATKIPLSIGPLLGFKEFMLMHGKDPEEYLNAIFLNFSAEDLEYALSRLPAHSAKIRASEFSKYLKTDEEPNSEPKALSTSQALNTADGVKNGSSDSLKKSMGWSKKMSSYFK